MKTTILPIPIETKEDYKDSTLWILLYNRLKDPKERTITYNVLSDWICGNFNITGYYNVVVSVPSSWDSFEYYLYNYDINDDLEYSLNPADLSNIQSILDSRESELNSNGFILINNNVLLLNKANETKTLVFQVPVIYSGYYEFIKSSIPSDSTSVDKGVTLDI